MAHTTVRILCIDDDKMGCEMLTAFLQQHNTSYELTSVSNPAEAANAIAQEKFDIYIVDNWLPGETGIDICKEIRTTDQTTAIVTYSAVAGHADVEEGLDAGVDVYLTKPNDIMVIG